MARPRSLFVRTGIALAISFAAFLVFTVIVVIYFVLAPVANRAADDLASLMVLSAQTWVELPPTTRPDFERVLLDEYQLRLSHSSNPVPVSKNPMPYLQFLRDALEKRTQTSIPILVEPGDPTWFSVDMPMAGQTIRVSFPRERIGAQPPLASLLVVIGGTIIILLASLLFVRRLTGPLANLSQAAARLGRGMVFEPLPETGPRELMALTHSFNQMVTQVTDLMENRTTLLAGISHDLRTPITRMRLALELLHDDVDTSLKNRLTQDLDEMSQLISRSLELARGLGTQEREEIDLQEFIDGVITDYQGNKPEILWKHSDCCICVIDVLALRRILTNLIDNALRYGGGKPVEVLCDCYDDEVVLRVLDRGEGVPAEKREVVFRPFHRLESSRSSATGGSGLGLAIAKQLSDRNNWQIQLLSREGGGTEARLQIPLNDQALVN